MIYGLGEKMRNWGFNVTNENLDVTIGSEYRIVDDVLEVQTTVNGKALGWMSIVKVGELNSDGEIITKEAIEHFMEEHNILEVKE